MDPQNGLARGALLSLVTSIILVGCGGGGGGGGGGQSQPAPNPNSAWSINASLVVDGGPGKDGIPALQNPTFMPIGSIATVADDDLVIAVRRGTETRVYPHDVMDYHEITNDDFANEAFVVSYCPLTGTALGWEVDQTLSDKTFGGSGLLYNSNLILYDRETNSLWSQMRQESINGPRLLEVPQHFQVLETTKATVAAMYPAASVMTRDTGHVRDYDDYPYGSFREDEDLLFPVENEDVRLHPKTRVLSVIQGSDVRAFQIDAFSASNHVLNEQIGGEPMVIIGNSSMNFAVAFERTLPGGVALNFSAVDDIANPSHLMSDDEGNIWDVFGSAVSGPRAGTRLTSATAFVAYWYALVAFHPSVEIYFNPT